MTIPATLLFLQETLPPPPAPTTSPEIDTLRVMIVVAIALVAVFVLALVAKPFVVKSVQKDDLPAPVEDPEAPVPDENPVQAVDHAAIIPFPASDPRPGDDALTERLQWVTGTTGRRRKLGDRAPSGPVPSNRRAMSPSASSGGVVIPFQSATPVPPAKPTVPAQADESMPALLDSEFPASPPEPDDTSVEETTGVVAAFEPTPEETMPVQPYANGHHHAPNVASLAPHSRGEPTRPADSILGTDLLETLSVEQSIKTAPAPAAITDDVLAGITQAVRELLFCANVGELLHGFALYSDPFLFRFMDASGMTEEEFQQVYGSVPPKAPEEWTRLAGLWDVVALPDGKVEATATYRDVTGGPANGAERYRFQLSADQTYWMIDDIRSVERPRT